MTSTATNAPLSANQGKVLQDTKVTGAAIVNNLTSTATNAPLSANQGKQLQDTKVAKSGDTMSGLLRLTAGLNFNASGGDTLSNYEVGTWTPIDGSGAGLTFSFAYTPRYIRIGKAVFISARFTYPSTSSTGDAELTGLPFALASGQSYGVGVISSDGIQANGFIIGTNRLIIHSQSSLSNSSVKNMDLSGKQVFINTHYFLS